MKNKLLNIIGIIAVALAIVVAVRLTNKQEINIGTRTENMDTTIKPGDNFYDYATLGWRRGNPIPNDYSRYGAFDALRDANLERVRKISEQDNGKIGKLYSIAMNAERLNFDGTTPVERMFDDIDAIKSRGQLAKYLGESHKYSSTFWGDTVELDMIQSDHYIYALYQGGTGLSRDYYFDDDEKSAEIRKKYKKYLADQMKNFGIAGDAAQLYALEERMAKSFYKKELLRDPHANYHKMTVAELKKEIPGFNWDEYLAARGVKTDALNLGQPEPIAESVKIINDTDLELIKTYLKFRIASSAAAMLDDKTYDIQFDFYNRTMAGQQEPKPRWKRSVAMINDALGEEVGKLYVKEYFGSDAKNRMKRMVKNLQRAYAMRIENLDWMSDETKKQALAKLDTFKAKIGYPDKWRDYSKLKITEDSLFENMIRVTEFEDAYWIAKIGKPVDPDIWYMNAHEVNAYYDPSTNEICFPAGILQYPFFGMEYDDAFNYGGIGSVIGHEMTHGFDDQGRKFDKDGNLRDWWTEQDGKNFDTRTRVMRDFFDKIEVAPGTYANGEFTLGENLADYGGATISFTAYQNFGEHVDTINGLTPQMRFFLAYAGVWAQNIRDAEVLRLTKIDVHSLGKWRVNGILPHVSAWYDAFDIKPDDKLYIAPEKRLKLW